VCPYASTIAILTSKPRLDKDTEAIVQQLVKEKFGNLTVITIAHHLDTIMDYDLIGVMDRGAFVEVGEPQVLKIIPNGHFQRLINLDRSEGE
jgi:ABC-type multidrug transport system fused ATPase/permease subunit